VRTVPRQTKHSHAGAFSQIGTQFVRGLLLIGRDRALVALLVGQPLLIGFLITLSQVNPGDHKLNPLVTFAVIASIWLGLNNTAREVVRDRSVYVRERRTTVNPESYLLAKVALFACIGLAQLLLLVLWLRYGSLFVPGTAEKRGPGWDAYQALLELPLLKFLLVLWVTYLSAMLLGLLVSTLAPTEEVAVAVLPLVVLPQLLLTAVAAHLIPNVPGGWFTSLDVLIDQAGHPARAELGLGGWLLELLSLGTYSRPALVFFLEFNENDRTSALGPRAGEVVKWAHLLVMLLATATAFVAVFLRRERRWLEAG
jgi:hypothetical protein